jgi:ABC-type branched-subunit amino acid transport system substrate-binding protein
MALALVAVVSTSCSSSPAASPTLRVAFFQNLGIDDHAELVSPSYFGLQIGLTEGGQGLTLAVDQFDIGLDPSGGQETARKIASNPAYVAVVLAPFLQESPEVAKIFADSGLAVVSLSPDSQSGGTGAAWRRLVPAQDAQASELAGALQTRGTNGVCLGSASDPYSTSLAAMVRQDLPSAPTVSFQIEGTSANDAVKAIQTSSCSVVGWVGFPSAASALRSSLSSSGMSQVPMVGADAMKTISYIQEPGRDGTLVTCPCVDLSTSSKLSAQRLVHDYQAATGLEPGIYAAEGWDAAGMLLQVLRGGHTRSQVSSGLAGMTGYVGVARDYSFAPDGSLAADTAAGLFVSTGVRWIQVTGGLGGGAGSNGA